MLTVLTCSVKRCTKVMQPINRSKLQNSFVFLFERFLARRKALQRKSAHIATAESVDTTIDIEERGIGNGRRAYNRPRFGDVMIMCAQ